MKKTKCSVCGGDTKRNGTTSSGRQRWRCKFCGASTTQKYNNEAKLLKQFLDWLLSKKTQAEMGIADRTFRHLTAQFWDIWPVLPLCDEIHHVVYMDGLWLSRKAVLLIACTDEHVIGCHLARSENSKDWSALMSRIAPPDVLVTDGGGGILKACRAKWQNTRIQCCTFHAFCQVKRYTTIRPNLQAGVELYGISKDLLKVKDLNQAALWLANFSDWCSTWDEFLKERTIIDGRKIYKHERLRKARRSLEKLCQEGTLFTYLDERLLINGSLKPTTNTIEGGVNAQIRNMLREHRGMNVDRRIKAGFWWCYMHSECLSPYSEMLKTMPTDKQVMEWRRQAAQKDIEEGDVARWGTGIVWAEFHTSTPWHRGYD